MHPRRRRGSSPSATIAAPTRAHLPPSPVDPDRGRRSATVTWYCLSYGFRPATALVLLAGDFGQSQLEDE
ncbi:uncharacterized protein SCHCODRAFT_02696016 [Schizophyllum commune H4-8]|uniref:uncharacterized protein n=1 Tax=Schizophyllum commune (strain H4-8 / FGSC 9210) TaxID=578458 RepID=UPI0021610270|nr:uncharacterized protein SCHCODRAFT_02696016 [Schizophyllum commune H4-8]KAI5900874.1 hypothetical protein SCHCODRAFT_02696016 [Schizophyllum commune H4-8]